MSHNRISRVALRWTPQRKRKQGRPKASWRRTVEKETKGKGSHMERGGNGRSGKNRLEAENGGIMLLTELRGRRRRIYLKELRSLQNLTHFGF